MADEIVAPVAPVTPVAPIETAPAAPVSTPEITPAVVPVETPAPVTEPSPAVEQVPEAAPADAKAEPKTLLAAEPKVEPKVEAPKADEIKPVEGEKKDEASQSDEPAPLPTYDAFTMPDGLVADEERIGKFTKLLGAFENDTKADHAKIQGLGQTLIDTHVSEVKSALDRQTETYTALWEKQKNDWKESFVNDPEIGGNRQNTTIQSALEFIRTHGGNEAQQTEFRNLMESSGLGNHPAMIRMLANAANAYREGSPVPAQKPVPQSTSKVARRYGGNA